jgi:hypothetical protein
MPSFCVTCLPQIIQFRHFYSWVAKANTQNKRQRVVHMCGCVCSGACKRRLGFGFSLRRQRLGFGVMRVGEVWRLDLWTKVKAVCLEIKIRPWVCVFIKLDYTLDLRQTNKCVTKPGFFCQFVLVVTLVNVKTLPKCVLFDTMWISGHKSRRLLLLVL